MGNKVTVNDIANFLLPSGISKVNVNFDRVADEFDEVLYRDGSQSLQGDLDMDSNRIYNLPFPISDAEPIRKDQIGEAVDEAIAIADAALSNYVNTAQIYADGAYFSEQSALNYKNLAQASAVNAETSKVGADTAKNAILTDIGFIAIAADLTGPNNIGLVADNMVSIISAPTYAAIAEAKAVEIAAAAADIAKNSNILSDYGQISTPTTKNFGPGGSGGSSFTTLPRRLAVLDTGGNITSLTTATSAAGTFKLTLVRVSGSSRNPVAQATLTSVGTAVATYPVTPGVLIGLIGDELWIEGGSTAVATSADAGGTGYLYGTSGLTVGVPFTPTSTSSSIRPRGLAVLSYNIITYENARITVSVSGLAQAEVWADGTVATAQDPEGIFKKLAVPVPSDGSVIDAKRYRDEISLVPPTNTYVPAFLNNSASWVSNIQKTSGVGNRLPTGAWTGGSKIEAFCLNFISGTTDTSTSNIAWNTGTLTTNKRSVTFGTAQTLVTDSEAGINKLVNPCAGYRSQDGGVVLFSRDSRSDITKLKFYELGFNTAGAFTKGIGGVSFTVGGTDAGAREVVGIIDPTWTRAYMCPQRIITLPDGTYIAPGWAVVGTSYRIFLLKRGIGDTEWTRFWTIAEGQVGIANSDRVQGEQSVVPLSNGNLLVVDRRTVISSVSARAWWEVDLTGTIINSGLYTDLFDAPIGTGMCRLDSGHILAIGPRTSLGTGQSDIGMHAAVMYDDSHQWRHGPAFRNISKVGRDERWLYRASLTGVTITPILSRDFSGNSVLIPIGDGLAVGLIEGRGPTDAGTVGNYTCIEAKVLNAASALRNAASWENI